MSAKKGDGEMDPKSIGVGEENVPPEEAEEIKRELTINLSLLNIKVRPVLRSEHPKSDGAVRAEFEVLDDLPEALKIGVFRVPARYPAVIRFSNGRATDDNQGDIHGMAIKLFGVSGERALESDRTATTQDFVLADDPVFFIKNVKEYLYFSRLVFQARSSLWGKIVFIIKLIFSRSSPWPSLKRAISKKPDSPLRIAYWSQTPYRLGERAVKYHARPDLSLTPAPAPSRSPNKLRIATAEHLREHDSSFDFMIQLQTDPIADPIEDPTVIWDENRSPFVKVATLRIPRQVFDVESMNAFGERLSFNPWHTLVEHAPLGGINRARRAIYDAMSIKRRELDGFPLDEPVASDIPAV
jgi:hypothetical protein